VTYAAFSSDGSRIETTSDDDTARIWDTSTGGSRALTADNSDRIWDVGTNAVIAVLHGPSQYAERATFSPDGSRIVTGGGDATARVWNGQDGKEIVVLRGHQGPFNFVAFGPDGSHIVTVGSDETIRIWEAASGREIAVLGGRGKSIRSAAFSPDGSRVVTAEGGNIARVWDIGFATMQTGDLINEVCLRRLRGTTTSTRDEMRLAGYADDMPAIDICAGIDQPVALICGGGLLHWGF
jgi:WD40 repeat protein